MFAGLLCVGNNAKERRRDSQYENGFTLPRRSILNLQLVELTNVDSKDTGGGCGTTSELRARSCSEFQLSLAWHHQTLRSQESTAI